MTNPPADDPLGRARRGLRMHRWTTVITTMGTGVVLVALASRLGVAVAVTVAIIVVAATGLAVRHAVAGDRRWRRAMQGRRNPGADGPE